MKFRINLLIESNKLSANHYDDVLSYEAYLVPNIGDKIKINDDDMFLVLERILPTTDNRILLIGKIIEHGC